MLAGIISPNYGIPCIKAMTRKSRMLRASNREFPAGERGRKRASEYIFEPRTQRRFRPVGCAVGAHVTVPGYKPIWPYLNEVDATGINELGWYHEASGFRPHGRMKAFFIAFSFGSGGRMGGL